MKIIFKLTGGGRITEYEAEVDEADAEEARKNFNSMFQPPHANSKGRWIAKLHESGYGRLALKQKPMEGKPDGGALLINIRSVLYTRRKGVADGSL